MGGEGIFQTMNLYFRGHKNEADIRIQKDPMFDGFQYIYALIKSEEGIRSSNRNSRPCADDTLHR
jgi:hypothetical protein